MAWKPEVMVAGEPGKWHRNALVFATEKEAKENAEALAWRWLAVNEWRAVEVEEPVNYAWVEGKLVEVKAAEAVAA